MRNVLVAVKVLLVLLLGVASGGPAAAEGLPALDYEPGRGLRVGETGLTLGGYADVKLERDEGAPAELEVDDIALFVSYDPHPRLHLFAELEGEDLVHVDDQGRGGTNDADFVVERLHADLLLDDRLVVRGGKFLTPVGRWNVIHAPPLVWTTSRPLVTTLPFDPHTTGLMLFGAAYPSGGVLSYSAYGQFTEPIDPEHEFQRQDRGGGGRLEYGRGTWSVGGSYLAFLREASWHNVTGIDGVWRDDRFEVMGEAAYVATTRGPDQWGLYVQGVAELGAHVFLVARWELYDPPSRLDATNLGVFGLAWKPLPNWVVKAEYLVAEHPIGASPPGFKSSIAVLF